MYIGLTKLPCTEYGNPYTELWQRKSLVGAALTRKEVNVVAFTSFEHFKDGDETTLFFLISPRVPLAKGGGGEGSSRFQSS